MKNFIFLHVLFSLIYLSQADEIFEDGVLEQFDEGSEAAQWPRELREAPSLSLPSQGMLRSLRSAENPRSGGILRSLRSYDPREGGILRSLRSADPREGGILRSLRSADPRESGILRSLRSSEQDPRNGGIMRSLRSSPKDGSYQTGLMRSLRSPLPLGGNSDFIRHQGILRSTRSAPIFQTMHNLGALRSIRSDIYDEPHLYDDLTLRYL